MGSPTLQRAQPGGRVVDRQAFDTVDESAVASPVVRVSLGYSTDTWLKSVQQERTGAGAGSRVRSLGYNPKMVIGQHVREVRISAAKCDRDLVRAGALDV